MIVLIFAPLAIGIFLLVYGFIVLKQKRLVENIPTSKIRSIAMGLAEITGTVKEIKTVKSPLAQKACVYFDYHVQEHRGSGKSSRWVTLRKGKHIELFYLEDETGKVMIDMNKADVNLYKDIKESSSLFKGKPNAKMMAFLEKEGLRATNLFGITKQMRFDEHFIEPKDKLYILGNAMDNPYVEEGSGVKNEEDIIIGKGPKGSYFTVSDKEEKQVLNRLKLKFGLLLAFGLFLTILGIILLITLFNVLF